MEANVHSCSSIFRFCADDLLTAHRLRVRSGNLDTIVDGFHDNAVAVLSDKTGLQRFEGKEGIKEFYVKVLSGIGGSNTLGIDINFVSLFQQVNMW